MKHCVATTRSMIAVLLTSTLLAVTQPCLQLARHRCESKLKLRYGQNGGKTHVSGSCGWFHDWWNIQSVYIYMYSIFRYIYHFYIRILINMSNLFFDYIVIVCLLYQCFVGIIVVNGIEEKDVKWLKFSISSQAFRYQQERLESIPHLGCQRKRYWSLVFFDVWGWSGTSWEIETKIVKLIGPCMWNCHCRLKICSLGIFFQDWRVSECPVEASHPRRALTKSWTLLSLIAFTWKSL